MELYGNLRNPVEILGNRWTFEKSGGNPWNSMETQGNSMEIYGNPVEIFRILWKSMESGGNQWNSVEIYGN